MAVREGSRSGAMWPCERRTSSVRGRGRKRERERKAGGGFGRVPGLSRTAQGSLGPSQVSCGFYSIGAPGLGWVALAVGFVLPCCQVPTWRCRCVWVRAAGVRRMRSGRARRFFGEWVGSLLVPIGKRSKCGVFILSSHLNCLNSSVRKNF